MCTNCFFQSKCLVLRLSKIDFIQKIDNFQDLDHFLKNQVSPENIKFQKNALFGWICLVPRILTNFQRLNSIKKIDSVQDFYHFLKKSSKRGYYKICTKYFFGGFV